MHHHPPPTGWLSTLDKRPGSSRGPMWKRSGAATMEDMAKTDVVIVRGLRKTYGNLVVVDRLDLDVPAGEIVGLAGTDGAGKTTTVECIQGLRRPDAGPAGHPRRRTASCRPAAGAAPISQHAAQRGDLDRALCPGRPADRHRPRCRDLRKRPWGRPRPTAGRRSPAQRTACGGWCSRSAPASWPWDYSAPGAGRRHTGRAAALLDRGGEGRPELSGARAGEKHLDSPNRAHAERDEPRSDLSRHGRPVLVELFAAIRRDAAVGAGALGGAARRLAGGGGRVSLARVRAGVVAACRRRARARRRPARRAAGGGRTAFATPRKWQLAANGGAGRGNRGAGGRARSRRPDVIEPLLSRRRVLDGPLRRVGGARQGREGAALPGPAAGPSRAGVPRGRPGDGRPPATTAGALGGTRPGAGRRAAGAPGSG